MANKAVWEQRSLPAELCEWCGICDCTSDDLGAQALLKVMHRQKNLIHHHRCRIPFLSGLVMRAAGIIDVRKSHSVLLVERKEHFPVLQQKSLAEIIRMKWVLPLGNYTNYRDVHLACFIEVSIFLQLPGNREEREALMYWEKPQILLTDLLNRD